MAFYEDPAVDDLIANAAFSGVNAVFEFGCGTGRLARRLLEDHLPEDSSYCGFDVSATMVHLARELLADWQGRARIELSGGSSNLPAPDGDFDRFVSVYVFDLLEPRYARILLEEAHRILAPGGRLCLVSLTRGTTPISRLVTWIWTQLYALRPQIVGGCRPIELRSHLSPDRWQIEYRSNITAYGVTSEVIVAANV